MPNAKAEEIAHTTVRAMLQLIPFIGGATAEFVGLAWSPPTNRRLKSFCEKFEHRLASIGEDMHVLRERVEKSEPAQVLIADTIAAAVRTTSDEQRTQLALLLAKSLESTDREIANATFFVEVLAGVRRR